jgi:hypothetical protein
MSFKNGMRPVHPGEVLREDFLRPADLRTPCGYPRHASMTLFVSAAVLRPIRRCGWLVFLAEMRSHG